MRAATTPTFRVSSLAGMVLAAVTAVVRQGEEEWRWMILTTTLILTDYVTSLE